MDNRGENRPKDIAAVVKDIGKMYWRENQRALNGLVIEYEKGLVSEEGAEDGEWRRYIIYYILFEESSGYWSMIETNKARGIEKIYEEGFMAKIVEKEFKQGFSKIPKNKHMDKSGRVEGDKEEKVEQEEEAQNPYQNNRLADTKAAHKECKHCSQSPACRRREFFFRFIADEATWIFGNNRVFRIGDRGYRGYSGRINGKISSSTQ
ncbi:hypothetical protein AX774_g3562 [Zancudomyces culisetae]|uniref:Uncharacterized protein n=1 Tax=Zancudomyces culisetae TaxID=1213189 RepID=A0A1R1PPQ1_ZANCU|nr:hypothetical protein AX774_g3562 [Zancudomyces culisetae]|eukprot:OMH82944.1 hypothetical protein AX774_g3562 [Zancudomyces culisetae]